jgi:hypothetical protein
MSLSVAAKARRRAAGGYVGGDVVVYRVKLQLAI